MSNPTLSVVGSNDTTSPDPFDLKALQLTQDFIGTAGVKKQLLTIPVRKPNPQDFIRVHPDEQYRANLLTIELKDDREIYLVTPTLYAALQGETTCATIFTAINRQGVTFLWAVRIPPVDAKDNAWWQSSREGAELAMKVWGQIAAQDLGGRGQGQHVARRLRDHCGRKLDRRAGMAAAIVPGTAADRLQGSAGRSPRPPGGETAAWADLDAGPVPRGVGGGL